MVNSKITQDDMEHHVVANSTTNCTDADDVKGCSSSSVSAEHKREMLFVVIVVSFYALPIFCLLLMLFRRRTKGKMLDMQVDKYFSGLEGVRKRAMVEKIIHTNLSVPGNYMSDRFAARRGSARQVGKRCKPKSRILDELSEFDDCSLASDATSKAVPKFSVGSMSNFSDTCSESTVDFDLESETSRRSTKPLRLQHAVVCLNARKVGGQPITVLGDAPLTPLMDRRHARMHAGRKKRPIVTYFAQSNKPQNYHLEPVENHDGIEIQKIYNDDICLQMENHLNREILKDIDECDDDKAVKNDVKVAGACAARETLGNREEMPDTPRRARRGGAFKPPETMPMLTK